MRFKDEVQIDILKKYGFQLVEHNVQTGFKRFTKHYGSFLVTVCNNRLEKRIHLTLLECEQEVFADKHIIASIHQINKDLCHFASLGLLALEEAKDEQTLNDDKTSLLDVNDWDAQMAYHNPFSFLNN